MDLSGRCPALRAKLGDAGLLELKETLGSHARELKGDIMETANDRFERRLKEEIGDLRYSIIRWMFGFFLAYLSVTLSVVGLILHAVKLL